MIVKGIEFIGRFDFTNKECIQFAWSGSTIKIDFYGTSVAAKFNSSSYKDYLIVLVDDQVINESLHIDHDGEYLLANHLELSKHTMTIVKKTEFTIGTISYKGISIDNGYLVERKESPFNFKMQIIGDSLTCGFGSEGNEKLEYDSKYDNAFLAYGLIAARKLNADCRLISISGRGLIRNYSGDMIHTMPTMIDKITPFTDKSWDDRLYIPDIVAINLGTNDFTNGYTPDKEHFVTAYIQLIDTIFKKFPRTKVICTIGPVLTNNVLELTKSYVKEVVSHYKNSVYFLEYDQQLDSDGFGLSYHPSLITHEKMSNTLVNKINEIL